MNVEQFFELFLEELQQNADLRNYYRFLNSKKGFSFRKAYFCKRLQYVKDVIDKKESKIWDCGCGFGTTGIFLSLNGIASHGTTLEFYEKQIPKRLEYWSNHGNVNLFSYSYENLFDKQPAESSQDYIIVQDTLHHLEPIKTAVDIFYKVLKPDGKLVVVEENGRNIIQRFKLYLRRGNKRIIELYDEKLKKKILLGNENIRALDEWTNVLGQKNFLIEKKSLEYIRLFPPFMVNTGNYKRIMDRESQIWKRNNLLREYFYFGINFTAYKISV